MPAGNVKPVEGVPRSRQEERAELALQVPTATWLVRGSDEKSWILIDAGPSTPSYQKSFTAAVKSLLSSPEDEIRLILLTHGHPDHVEVRCKLQGYFELEKASWSWKLMIFASKSSL